MFTSPLLPRRPQRQHGATFGLIAVFTGLYFLVGQEPSAGHSYCAMAAHTQLLPLIMLLGSMLLFMGMVRSTQAFHQENNQALELLHRGQVAEAAARFTDLRARYERSNPSLAAVAAHNAGWTELRRGKVDDALFHYAFAEEIGLCGTVRHTTAVHLAVLHALRGERAAAADWLAEAGQRGATPLDVQLRLLPEALIHCRNGAWVAAINTLDRSRREAEATLTGDVLRLLRVVRAFALSQGEGPFGSGAAAAEVAVLKPGRPGELAWLCASWPELELFLRSSDLLVEHPPGPAPTDRAI